MQPLMQQSTVSGAVGAGQPAANRENVDGGLAGAITSWQRGGRRFLLAGTTTSRRQDRRRCFPTGATKSRRWGGQWYSLACVTMVLMAGQTTVLWHRWPSLAHWCDDELVMGPMALLACWRADMSAAGRKAVLAHLLAPSGNGSTAVNILGRNHDWLDRESLRGPLLVCPGKGGKIPKSLAGQSATVGAASLVRTRSQPPGRLNVTFVNVKPAG